MATLGTTALTLADLAKRMDPDGSTAQIVELLTQKNEILEDMHWEPGNLTTGHRTTVRTKLPSVGWRRLNLGVLASKSQVAQMDEACGLMEAFSEVDEELLALADNPAQTRLQEDSAFLEAMNEEMASTLFYGNAATAIDEFNGLATRYASLTGDYADSMISGAGAGSDNTSIYVVVWGPTTVFGIVPKNTKAGLEQKDLGVETKTDSNNRILRVARTQFKWRAGLAVKDWRYVIRICNIDVSNLIAESSAADLIKLLIRALERIPSLSAGRAAIYCNRTVRTMLRIQMLAKSNLNLTLDTIAGKKVLMFDGIPVRQCDQLLTTEATVS